ncbi:MAG: PAS domain S-box protein [Mariprofundaceae bacterium]|nr:PAS domain S-box protein [Mariprofundaceae bacterium]
MSEQDGLWLGEGRPIKKTAYQQLSRADVQHMLDRFNPDELVNYVYHLERQRLELQDRNKCLQEEEVKYSVLLEHYRLLYQYAPVGYVTIDYSGTVMKANHTLAVILGYELDDLLRESLPSLMPEPESKFFNNRIERLCQSGKGHYETRFVTEDRGVIDVLLEGTVFESGEVIHLNVVDITEYKLLQAQYKMYVLAMHESPSATMILDSSGVVTRVNKSLCQHNRVQQQDVLGKHVSTFYTLDHDVGFFEKIQPYLVKKRQWLGQVVFKDKEGKAYHYGCLVCVARHEAAKQVNYVLMFDVLS